jgi:lysozyme family protein
VTDRFINFIPFILEWETEFNKDGSVRTEHDPDDPGGTTRYGIDQRSHPDVDVENLTKEQATKIYYDEWVGEGIENMAPKLGEAYYNACVNTGVGQAKRFLEQSNKTAQDFLQKNADFYRRLAERRRFRKYLNGWLNRIHALWRYLELNNG